MSRIAYVNGAYVPLSHAYVHIEDRGYQFADGVYEGIAVRRGRMVDLEPHLNRLWRSLGELSIPTPMARGPMTAVFREVIRQNRARDAFLYIQITRGVARRDHGFPADCWPAFVVTCRRLDFDGVAERAKAGVKAVSHADIRWGRCDVKSISLLPNVLAKQAARDAGAFETVMVDKDGFVTEGSSTNIWMVTKDGMLVTRSTADNILPGITRMTVSELAHGHQMVIEERAFSLEEAKDAAELFLTSSTAGAMPIIELDGNKIGDGTPGPVASRLAAAYMDFMNT